MDIMRWKDVFRPLRFYAFLLGPAGRAADHCMPTHSAPLTTPPCLPPLRPASPHLAAAALLASRRLFWPLRYAEKLVAKKAEFAARGEEFKGQGMADFESEQRKLAFDYKAQERGLDMEEEDLDKTGLLMDPDDGEQEPPPTGGLRVVLPGHLVSGWAAALSSSRCSGLIHRLTGRLALLFFQTHCSCTRRFWTETQMRRIWTATAWKTTARSTR